MGCLHSRNESSDLHPNVFRVINIDDNETEICAAQLEITDSNIVVYREGRERTVWPLQSLRRYGFDDDVFSFESGRRCDTGPGVYAFRCRRASLLFSTLQQRIQLRNVNHDSVPHPVSRLTPSLLGRQTLQASVVHRSSVDNGQVIGPGIANPPAMVYNGGAQRLLNQSPRSPSSADILEVTPLYPRNQNNSNHATNVYQLREFKREHNNNTQPETSTDSRHEYSNDFNRDLAMLRNTLKQEAALNTMRDIEDEAHFLESRFVNQSVITRQTKSPLSPTLSNSSEHYAQLSSEQQASARMYMNIGPNDKHFEKNRIEIPSNTPKQVELCNLSQGAKLEIITYANLALGEIGETIRNAKHNLSFSVPSEQNQKLLESDTIASLSPVEDLEVNYAILDIDTNKDVTKVAQELASAATENLSGSLSSKTESAISVVSQARGRLVSQTSVERPPLTNASSPPANIGYTTIDFDKTVALTSVAAGTDKDAGCDGSRKTRHNSCNLLCNSPGSNDKNKTFSKS